MLIPNSHPQLVPNSVNSRESLLVNQIPTNLAFNDDYLELTHYMFRFPAKFHPPIARKLLEEYSQEGQWVLDPFCGSGSLLVEAAVIGRNAIGMDIDPIAVLISRVKTRALDTAHLSDKCEKLRRNLEACKRPDEEYETRKFNDLDVQSYLNTIEQEKLFIPNIPNIFHWFRKYVIIDLARIYREISCLNTSAAERDFFRVCFASIIRKSSNADPIPVSGLEVTSHIKRLDENGRIINPFYLFESALAKNFTSLISFVENRQNKIETSVYKCNALLLTRRIHNPIDLVVTSPPYHNAVDYYRRHTLETFWLRLVSSQEERVKLRRLYIGSSATAYKNYLIQKNQMSTLILDWNKKISEYSQQRANQFLHYMVDMKRVFKNLSHVMNSGNKAVFVVGHSKWNGDELPTSDLFAELAKPFFALSDIKSYPIKNKYMSYSRHNGANINTEYVLVFKRT